MVGESLARFPRDRRAVPMLLKAPDDKSQLIIELDLLETVAAPPRKRQIAEDSRILRAGLKGEQASATIRAIGLQLVALHTPATKNYADRFGVAKPARPATVSKVPNARPFRVSSSPTPGSGSRRQPLPTCRHCGSGQLFVQPGRFSFHFTCAFCNKHTPIQIGCGKTGHQERLRQDGRTFYRECADCRTRSVFFVNPEAG